MLPLSVLYGDVDVNGFDYISYFTLSPLTNNVV